MKHIKNRNDLSNLSSMLDQGFFQLLENELEFLKKGYESMRHQTFQMFDNFNCYFGQWRFNGLRVREASVQEWK
jgi:hypothetical protein